MDLTAYFDAVEVALAATTSSRPLRPAPLILSSSASSGSSVSTPLGSDIVEPVRAPSVTESAGVGAAAVNWTVEDPGSITPSTSNDYGTWTVEQLRKECTSRKLRLSWKPSADKRVQQLLRFDAVRQSMQTSIGTDPASASAPRKTGNCAFRLLNILFSDGFSARFVQEGGDQ